MARGRAGDDEEGYASDLTSRVMERYHEVLRAGGAVDFDDLLLRAVALLEGYRSRHKLEPETVAALHAHARLQAVRWALGRLRTFPAGRPAGAQVVWKDWRSYRDRLVALRAMGPDGYLALLGLR